MPLNVSSPQTRSSFRSRLGELNPAFAAAHGISPVKSPATAVPAPETPADKKQSDIDANRVEVGDDQIPELPISPSPIQDDRDRAAKKKATGALAQANQLIARAQTSGKLQASDSGLETPLPKILFEFPSLADTVDMSMDTNPDKLKPWESHVAETLLLVDFSDNEGITEFPKLENTDNNHTSTNSIERYRSVQIFRVRRCALKTFPVTTTMQESWPQLLTLDLSGNQLTGAFPLLYLPKTIRELDLSGNSLTSLKSRTDPSTSIDLPQLVNLDVSNNQIPSTGISPVMHVPNLQRLNCGNNKLYNLNYILKAISSCEKSLTTLFVPKCFLSDLEGEQPIDLTAFTELLNVDMSGNSLSRVPKIPSTVQRLCINDNLIYGIDGLLEEENDESGDLKPSSLAVLQLQRNKLTMLDPNTIARLTQLTRLDLQYNSLKDLPIELGSLNNLQQMFLEGNHLLSLRSSGVRGDVKDTKAILTRLRNRGPANQKSDVDAKGLIKKSDVDAKGLIKRQSSDSADSASTSHSSAAINVEVGRMLDSVLVGTKVIKYEGNYAELLPLQLLEELKTSSPDIVHGIERLNVSKNQLQSIDDEWCTLLPKLRTLDAHDNRLSSLPNNIGGLSLVQMYLSKNCLTSHAIQSSILLNNAKSEMIAHSLQVLDLSSNNLDSFPPDLLRHFKSLRNLNLSRNQIMSLQNVVNAPHPPHCPTLEHLNLSENRIEDLDGDDFPLMLAVGCPKLQSLKIENNELVRVPMTLGYLENLKVLDLRGNPQRLIRYDILDKSTTYVLQYMRNRMTSKTKQHAMRRMQELRTHRLPGEESIATTPAKQASGEEAKGSNDPKHEAKDSKNDSRNHASPKKPLEQRKTIPSKRAQKAPAKATTPNTPSSKCRITPSKPKQGLSPAAARGHGTNSRTPTLAGGKGKSASSSKTTVTSPLLKELEKTIKELAEELDRPGLSEPKRYAIKKKLAMERSKRLREERRLKQSSGSNTTSRGFVSDPCVSLLR